MRVPHPSCPASTAHASRQPGACTACTASADGACLLRQLGPTAAGSSARPPHPPAWRNWRLPPLAAGCARSPAAPAALPRRSGWLHPAAQRCGEASCEGGGCMPRADVGECRLEGGLRCGGDAALPAPSPHAMPSHAVPGLGRCSAAVWQTPPRGATPTPIACGTETAVGGKYCCTSHATWTPAPAASSASATPVCPSWAAT
jgi:hypothetical protein